MKIVKIADPIHNKDISYIYQCSEDELQGFLEKNHGAGMLNVCDGVFFALDDKYYIYQKTFRQDISSFALLIHEIFHLVVAVKNDLGFELNEETNEDFAEYIQIITESFMCAITEAHEAS